MGIWTNFTNILKKQREFGIDYIEGPPYINTLYSYTQNSIAQQPENYRQILETYVKRSPELLSVLDTVIKDIVSDGYKFIPIDDAPTKQSTNDKRKYKKTRAKEADRWAKENEFKKELKAGLFDWLWAGNALWWYKLDLNSTKDKIKEILEKYNAACVKTKELLISNEEKDEYLNTIKHLPGLENIKIKEKYEQEFEQVRMFKHVPWTNVTILHDSLNILGYRQAVGTTGPIVDTSGSPIPGKSNAGGLIVRVWPPSQVLHAKYMAWDGKVYGYSPVLAAIPIVSILILLKNYAGRWFEQGGSPEKLFMFKNVGMGSVNSIKMKQLFQTYQKVGNKRGYYFGESPGDFEIHDLNKWDKDMEFRKLAVYCTSLICQIFQLPLARVQSVLGMEVKGGPSDISDAAYWRTISEMQDSIETLLNLKLFEPRFGVKIKFNNSYVQDEIREAQQQMQKMDMLAKKLDLIGRVGKQLKQEALLRLINGSDILEEENDISEDDLEEMTFPMQEGISGNRQGMMSNQKLMGSDQQRSETKKTEQLDKQEAERIRTDLKEVQDALKKTKDSKDYENVLKEMRIDLLKKFLERLN